MTINCARISQTKHKLWELKRAFVMIEVISLADCEFLSVVRIHCLMHLCFIQIKNFNLTSFTQDNYETLLSSQK